jgi:hypothetical protein
MMMKPNSVSTIQMLENSTIRVNDVLSGRGGATNNHEGNRRYRTIVADHQSEYLAAKKKEKVVISRKIVALVHADAGRFLRRDASGVWVQVPDKRAIEKTSQALREGLDVRNHTVRPKKQVRRLALGDDTTPKVVVTGWVLPTAPVVTPVMMGIAGGKGVPDLMHEKLHQPSFPQAFVPQQTVKKTEV